MDFGGPKNQPKNSHPKKWWKNHQLNKQLAGGFNPSQKY